MSSEIKKRSGAWYLLPIFLSIIGGVIAYFVIKEDDPKKAKNCLYLGIALTAVGIGLSVVMTTVAYEEFDGSSFSDTKMNWNGAEHAVPLADIAPNIPPSESDEGYHYNPHGLKPNYIHMIDSDGNILSDFDAGSMYSIVSEIRNGEDRPNTFYYSIVVENDAGIDGMSGEAIVSPLGTVIIDDGWLPRTPGKNNIEIFLEEKDVGIAVPEDSDMEYGDYRELFSYKKATYIVE